VDVLVNNAGMSPVYDGVANVSEALYDKVFAVNLKGPFRLSALFGARMVAGAGGSIINVSSVGSIRPTADIIPYAAAKAGLNAMTVAFADALGPKVRVNCIMPGSFLTDATRGWDMEAFNRHAQPRSASRSVARASRRRSWGRRSTSRATRRATRRARFSPCTAASRSCSARGV
jgi:NAD(P)-dependent dehydrogenase (short-subunit alcohol dehydrogenase family)